MHLDDDKPGPAAAAHIDRAEVTRLADALAEVLREWLSPTEWQEMRARNDTPEYADCCASHDFCDANMAMDEAFRRALGRPPDVYDRPDGAEGPDVALWNAAWADAGRRHLKEVGSAGLPPGRS